MTTERPHDQHKIWHHFQNAAPESFAAAHPRLEFLIGQIGRRCGSRSPHVLNIGIGDGYFERQAKARGWEVHSLDPDEQAVERLKADGIAAQVGFIEKLPHQLVEAFKATLEETVLSDLILHVVDASAGEERMKAEMAAADEVLSEIGAGDKPRLLVLNKVDLLDDEARAEARIDHPDAVQVSAVTGEGLERLRKEMERAFEETMAPVELLVPYSEGSRLHELHEVAGKVDREDGPEGVLVRTRLPLGEMHRFADLVTS